VTPNAAEPASRNRVSLIRWVAGSALIAAIAGAVAGGLVGRLESDSAQHARDVNVGRSTAVVLLNEFRTVDRGLHDMQIRHTALVPYLHPLANLAASTQDQTDLLVVLSAPDVDAVANAYGTVWEVFQPPYSTPLTAQMGRREWGPILRGRVLRARAAAAHAIQILQRAASQ